MDDQIKPREKCRECEELVTDCVCNETSAAYVYTAITTERLNQDRKYGKIEERGLSIADYILILEKELQEAKDGLIMRKSENHAALNEMVQVAASAVACLQYHGLKGNGK